mmetsp:Transcript_13143/g.17184  ORF Transcript_13143/g.17184 Transcript_13143/m.17184 type:complete len:479 (+) Transcript_13143:130-1566(+)
MRKRVTSLTSFVKAAMTLSSMALLALCNSDMTLRFRTKNGSIVRVTTDGNESLSDVLKRSECDNVDEGYSWSIGGGPSLDVEASVKDLPGVKNGSLISITSNKEKGSSAGLKRKIVSKESNSESKRGVWQPFPDLSKPNYLRLVRQARARANMKNAMNYADLENISSSLHRVEPQTEGRVKRIYLCSECAKKFQAQAVKKKNSSGQTFALLFGTSHKEREKQGKIARTSLSTTTDSNKMCEVTKVQALYMLPSFSIFDDDVDRAINLAKKLGLHIVGCIYSYDKNIRSEEEMVYSSDILKVAKLQCDSMRTRRISNFVFLSMEAQSGATEAFQLSDLSVQMYFEDILKIANGDSESPTQMQTSAPIMMDGKEVNEFDVILCLINTALLSHTGNFWSRNIASSKLTPKVKARLLKKLDKNVDNEFVDDLRDFSLLLALENNLDRGHMESLLEVVLKRSQLRNVSLDKDLKALLSEVFAT